MKVMPENAAPNTACWRFTCAVMSTQLKYDPVTPTLVKPPTARLRVQMAQTMARKARSVKMVKWVRVHFGVSHYPNPNPNPSPIPLGSGKPCLPISPFPVSYGKG